MTELKKEKLIEKKRGKLDPNGDFGLMSAEDLAEVLVKDPRTILNWVARREIPFVRVGDQTMFLRDSVKEWLQQKETKPHGRH